MDEAKLEKIGEIVQPIIEQAIEERLQDFEESPHLVEGAEINIEEIAPSADTISVKGSVSASGLIGSSKQKDSIRGKCNSSFQATLKRSEHKNNNFDLLDLVLDENNWTDYEDPE